ncbi:MAG: type II toxin-antitoxin system VapC family toxin [Nitrospira sp.]|nr:type II toxin-antitoxin system VapC family toxin [Nitrospira sp.]
MILIDANLLLYAYHPRSAQHEASRAWLEATLSGSELVRFAWLTIWAFPRVSTSPRVFEHPFSTSEAEAVVSSWPEQPVAGILDAGERHWDILCRLLRTGQATGPLVMDAVLAAIAIEHGAALYTTDQDFSRFPGLKWTNPLTAADSP